MAAAFAVAYLLVLQSVFGAYAVSAGPNPALLDAFGNVICTQDGAAEHPANGSHGRHMPDCCTFGCNLAAAGLAPPPDARALSAAFAFDTIGFVAPLPRHVPTGRDRSPANPRAPPLAA